jgi:internalin A
MSNEGRPRAPSASGQQAPQARAAQRIAEWRRPRRPAQFVRVGSVYTSEVLDLSGLGLTALPDEVQNLHDLELLNLEANQIQEIPSWIGGLSALKGLRLSNNRVRTLPSDIGKLSRLVELDLKNNQLGTLPPELLQPPLQSLFLEGNPELRLPESLLTSPAQQLLRYYFESRADKGSPLLELKLLLVGRGKAGKTTLLKRLAGEPPNAEEPETHSIAIRELILECPRGTIRSRAWDFGGQEILHSTHQFFLTERSLYLLVLEPRTGLAQRDAEYWLKLIETQGAASPTIVVMNWSHERPWRVDEVKLRRKFPFIVGFVATDALHGRGIADLHAKLLYTIENHMRDVWLPFPGRWHEIKNAVAGMRDNFLSYSQYTALCDGFGERDSGAQADLAEVLHALGLALYFGKDPRLHDTRVLSPSWVTGGVYAVIRAPSVANNDGQLAVTDMPTVLREAEEQKVIKVADYPPDTHRFILELMRAFQLCYASFEERDELTEGHGSRPVRYLVPELLPEYEPEMTEPWERASVRLRYRYEILPPGLLPRFIVRTHALSDDAPHWRHGVELRHANSKALIRTESDRNELHLLVLGDDDETCRVLTAIVRRELEALHAEMKLQPVEELALSGEKDQWIGVKALREFEQPDRPTQKLPIQPEGTAEINVTAELDKLVPPEARAIERDPATAPPPVRVFVGYARDDERQLKRLDAILDVLEQQHGLASWSDRRLIAGDEWNAEILQRLDHMDIFLFIASQSSMVQPYIKDPELRRARERRDTGEVELVVVKLEPCACDDDPLLGKLQRLAPKFRSIAEAPLKSAAWEQVRRDLLPVIERVRERKARIGGARTDSQDRALHTSLQRGRSSAGPR